MQNYNIEDKRICDSVFWDSNFTWHSGFLDFPDYFQQIVFVLIPCSIICVTGAINLWINVKRLPKCRLSQTAFYILKQVLCALLILIGVSELIITTINETRACILQMSIYSNFIKISFYIISVFILKESKRLGIYCSTTLSIFWFVYIICSAVRYSLFFMRIFSEEFVVVSVYQYTYEVFEFSFIVCQFYFSLFNDPPILEQKSFLEDSSCFSLSTFFWFNKYVYRGWKKLLLITDYQPLYFKLKADYLWMQFYGRWHAVCKHRDDKKASDDGSGCALKLGWILMKSIWPYFALACLLELTFDVLIFLPPLVLDKLISFASEDVPISKGYILCILLFVTNSAAQMISNLVIFASALFANQARTLCFSAIYQKAIKLSTSARQKYTSGEMINLMSVDVENVFRMGHTLVDVIASPLKSIVAIVMLWQYLGYSCLAGVAVIIIMIIIGFFTTHKIEKVEKKKMKAKDSRLKFMNEILNGIKVLKLYAWEKPFMEKITEIRKREVNLIRKLQLLFAASIFVWHAGPLFVGVATFVTYVFVNELHILTATKIFVSMNLLNLLQFTISDIPDVLARIVQTRVSLKRLSKFLLLEECDPEAIGHTFEDGAAISVKNGSFTWSIDSESTLRDINFSIPKGSLVAVIGPVGSGKSSLISAILGEMYKKSGFVNVEGNIAYVPQQAWILNRTLQENILFVSQVNQLKYDSVIDACGLRPDLEMLPASDKTEIGEKGVNLSGGQKQRISLARALIHDADVYLLDDPLSAVDVHVGKHIFEHVIGKTGLLGNKTRLFVTHNTNFLPETDFIITINDGKIQEAGKYSELMKRGGSFANFITEHSCSQNTNEEKTEKTHEVGKNNQSGDNNELLLHNISVQSENAKLVEDENMEIGKVKRDIYISYFKHLGVFFLTGLVMGTTINTAFEIGIDVWLSKWSGDVPLPNGTQDIKQRNFRVIVYVTLGVARIVIKELGVICLAFGSAKVAKLYHQEMLWSVMRAPMSFFDTTPQGRIVNRFGRDIEEIDSQIAIELESFGGYILYAIGSFVLIATNTPLFLPFLIPVAAVFYIIQKSYINISGQLKRLVSTSLSPVFCHFGETINGTSSINAYNVASYFIKAANDKLNINTACRLYFAVSKRWLEFNIQLLGNIIVLLATILVVASKDSLTPGTFGITITYAMSVIEVLRRIARSGTLLENQFISVERVEEYLQIPSEASWTVSESSPAPSWPTNGKLLFKDYSTRYRHGLDLVLKHINLNVNENEKVGIVGRTGAGKSSFTLALFRIIEAAEGVIFVDDIDIAKIGLHQLRSKFSIIPQDPILFTGSLRLNIDPGEAYSDDEVWYSLENAHLENFVSSLPEGLNYEVAEGGSNFSVGQRQLICLARALLKRAKILILDEATASVDMDTDQLIQNTIRSEFKNNTVITIAHRLNTIMDYDKIVVMDTGEIVEIGSPPDLLKNPNSYFHSMVNDAGLLQSKF